ncbi:MAG: DNA-formamidopyrimidine glycosylase [Acidobacteriia bacterium]|jgi:formamidopyrimidine-DNA glycosylase|nr:DNA-formamidopyrimidine glycosylase [Terriglobia bacterium]
MPELPEVEALVRLLRPQLCGQQIRAVHVRHAIVLRPQTARQFRTRVLGRRIAAVTRRGKYLLLRLAPQDAGWMALHFRLSGAIFWFADHRLRGHVDVAWELERGTLAYADPRHLGRVHWLEHPEQSAGIRTLGVEPLTRAFTVARLQALLRRSRRPLKPFLMEQTQIAGLGNIYAAEALWHAGLHPKRRASSLKGVQVRRLHKAIVEVLRRGIECCLKPEPDLSNPEWTMPGIEAMLAVYQRQGRDCPRCGRRIRRIRQGHRSTFYCPGCQH